MEVWEMSLEQEGYVSLEDRFCFELELGLVKHYQACLHVCSSWHII